MNYEQVPGRDRPYTGFDLRLANLAKFLIRHRRGAMVLQVIIFVACILGTLSLRLHDDPNAWPPRSDRFVHLNDRITQHFGGGNSVSIEISVDSGTVFTLPRDRWRVPYFFFLPCSIFGSWPLILWTTVLACRTNTTVRRRTVRG